jgi:hypothetical protein
MMVVSGLDILLTTLIHAQPGLLTKHPHAFSRPVLLTPTIRTPAACNTVLRADFGQTKNPGQMELQPGPPTRS